MAELRRILFTSRPLAGHFDPLLPLAEAAREAGHTVAIASGEPVAGQARELGFTAFTAGPPASFRAEWAPRFPHHTELEGAAQREFFFTEVFANLELVPRAADLDAVVADWRPDLVVHELAELAAPIVATAADIPCVDVGFGPLIPNHLLVAAGRTAAPHWERRGLAAPARAGLFSGLYVDPCPRLLQDDDGIDSIGAVQPMRPAAAGDGDRPTSPPPWLVLRPGRPLVYVTLGTTWNSDLDLFRLLIDAVASDADVVVTLGRQHDPAVLGEQPAHVTVRSYVPQRELLPWCDAVVAHGGAGTMFGALGAGCPLLVVPLGADQWANAARVERVGVGHRLDRREVTQTTVREAVADLIGDERYLAAARDVAAELAAMPTAAEALPAVVAVR